MVVFNAALHKNYCLKRTFATKHPYFGGVMNTNTNCIRKFTHSNLTILQKCT